MTTTTRPQETYTITPTKEAVSLARYLIGKDPSAKVVALYTNAVQQIEGKLDALDVKYMTFAFIHPSSLGMLDGGLALLRPHAELRHRIYIMFALLEVMPEYHKYFLPKQQRKSYIFIVGFHSLLAAVRGACGLLLVKFIGMRS